VNASLAATSGSLAGPVTNEGGTFDVRGTLSVLPSGAPNLALTMTPRAGDSTQARTLLIAAAPDGRWNVEFRLGPP